MNIHRSITGQILWIHELLKIGWRTVGLSPQARMPMFKALKNK